MGTMPKEVIPELVVALDPTGVDESRNILQVLFPFGGTRSTGELPLPSVP